MAKKKDSKKSAESEEKTDEQVDDDASAEEEGEEEASTADDGDEDAESGEDASADTDEDGDDEDDEDEDEDVEESAEDDEDGEDSASADDDDDSAEDGEPARASADDADDEKGTDVAPASVPTDPDAEVSEELRDLFGLHGDVDEDVRDYEPEVRGGPSPGGIIAVLIAVAAIVGLIIGAVQMLDKRQEEIEEAAAERERKAEEEKEPEVRYGNIAMMASEPPRALVLEGGNPIYVKTPDGEYTELRVAPDTRIQNIKIEEGNVVRYTLESEGFKPYEIELDEYAWTPIPGSGDWEKVYTKIRMEPEEGRFLSNCEEVETLGPPYDNICLVSRSEEIMSRKDFERIYVDPETEQPVRLHGELTVTSDPPGAKIFFNSKPLMKPDGTQATTPYTFTEYGKDAEGNPKKVSVTGANSDGRLSIRLEKEGLAPYVTGIWPHHWTCDPETNIEEIKAMKVPKKTEEAAPDMFHYLCDYSLE